MKNKTCFMLFRMHVTKFNGEKSLINLHAQTVTLLKHFIRKHTDHKASMLKIFINTTFDLISALSEHDFFFKLKHPLFKQV